MLDRKWPSRLIATLPHPCTVDRLTGEKASRPVMSRPMTQGVDVLNAFIGIDGLQVQQVADGGYPGLMPLVPKRISGLGTMKSRRL